MEGDIRSCHCTTIDVISIHALTWRATVLILVMAAQAEFLPTPSHGGRQDEGICWSRPRRISTHALTWRATHWRILHRMRQGFLPTPSHGGRPPPLTRLPGRWGYFYPRPHMEGDPMASRYMSTVSRFLPTPSHGGRPDDIVPPFASYSISTHALTWRATERLCEM